MGVAGEVALPVPVAGVTTGEGTEVGVRSGLALGTGSEVVTGAGILGPAPESFNATTKNVYLISGERPVNVAVPPTAMLVAAYPAFVIFDVGRNLLKTYPKSNELKTTFRVKVTFITASAGLLPLSVMVIGDALYVLTNGTLSLVRF